MAVQGRRSVFCIGGGGGGLTSKQASAGDANLYGVFWRNSPPKKFEVSKLGNATFSILDEIDDQKNKRGSTVK